MRGSPSPQQKKLATRPSPGYISPMAHTDKPLDVVVVGTVGIDTSVFLYGNDIDFNIEANFSRNRDYVGQAGGYCSRGFAAQGYRTALIGYVGEDPLGRWVREELTADEIDLSALFTDPAGTKRSVNFMYRDGRRKNFYDGRGSMEVRAPLQPCRALFSRARLAHFAIVNWARYLLPVARAAGCTISCDLQDVPAVDDAYRRDFVEAADILFFSAANFPDPTPLLQQFRALCPQALLVCGMGAQGCALANSEGIRFFPAVELEQPVLDSNGAGDGLAVGLLAACVLEGLSLEEAVLRGQITARHTCSIEAASDRLITRDQLEQYAGTVSHQAGQVVV